MVLQLILILGGLLALLLLVAGVIVSVGEERSLVEERLGRYLESEVSDGSGPGLRGMALTEWINAQTERFAWGESIAKELARADLKLKVGEYMVMMLLSSGLVGLIFWVVGGFDRYAAILGLVLGFFLPRIYVRSQQGRRLNRFNDQLSDMLNLMVNGLRAGFSTMQAMEAVSKELPAPICDEFRRVVQEMQLGVSMERALDNLLRRIPSADLDLVVTAINVQREVGGNLAEILDTISHTIRERVRIKGEIRVLTAQVMYSGRFLAAMPILLMLGLYLLNRGYMMHFFDEESRIIGIGALVMAGLLIFFGYVTMNKIGNIEV
jgi:tight adherence protein B